MTFHIGLELLGNFLQDLLCKVASFHSLLKHNKLDDVSFSRVTFPIF